MIELRSVKPFVFINLGTKKFRKICPPKINIIGDQIGIPRTGMTNCDSLSQPVLESSKSPPYVPQRSNN